MPQICSPFAVKETTKSGQTRGRENLHPTIFVEQIIISAPIFHILDEQRFRSNSGKKRCGGAGDVESENGHTSKRAETKPETEQNVGTLNGLAHHDVVGVDDNAAERKHDPAPGPKGRSLPQSGAGAANQSRTLQEKKPHGRTPVPPRKLQEGTV